MSDIGLALSLISKTLEPLVIGPPVTSIPIQRARYLVVLSKQLADGEITFRQLQERVGEFDKRNKKK